ncbi:MAG: substrate-binding domain-containing protein [Burkholderiales bacterium]|nr:substrate-binding domain-containing protein [Burkholderiales bacterium]
MAVLRLLSAGAAQAVCEQVIATFQRDTGHQVEAGFGAVGAMKARMVGGEPVDVIILSAQLIQDLVSGGMVAISSVTDIGKVGTGVAVRADTPLPEVRTREALRGNILAASVIVCPDPATATAGKIVMKLMERLGVAAQVEDRMQFFPNGFAAMNWLAASTGTLELGITQNTEILHNKGVTLVAPLPEEFQMKTVYTAGIAVRGTQPDLAREFVRRLTAPEFRANLRAAGFEINS